MRIYIYFYKKTQKDNPEMKKNDYIEGVDINKVKETETEIRLL